MQLLLFFCLFVCFLVFPQRELLLQIISVTEQCRGVVGLEKAKLGFIISAVCKQSDWCSLELLSEGIIHGAGFWKWKNEWKDSWQVSIL